MCLLPPHVVVGLRLRLRLYPSIAHRFWEELLVIVVFWRFYMATYCPTKCTCSPFSAMDVPVAVKTSYYSRLTIVFFEMDRVVQGTLSCGLDWRFGDLKPWLLYRVLRVLPSTQPPTKNWLSCSLVQSLRRRASGSHLAACLIFGLVVMDDSAQM